MMLLLLALLPQDPTADRIAEGIRRLESEDVAAREAAAAELEKLGEKALPPLRLARDRSTDAEVRSRLGQVVAALEVLHPGPLRIVFTRGEELAGELFVWEDGRETRLTENRAMESGARWSPDGKRLAYGTTQAEDLGQAGAYRIAVLDLSTRQETRLGEGRGPAWSPDGRRIAFARGKDLWVTDLEGREERVLKGAEAGWGRPAWSSDGKRIASESDSLLNLVDLEAGKSSTLAIPDGATTLYSFTLSPNGKRLAFVAGEGPYLWHAYAMDADGANLTRLTRELFQFGILRWSPDGVKLAACLEDGEQSSLWILDPKDGARTKLADGADPLDLPCWSPDGRFILFTRRKDEIWLAHTAGRALRKLTTLQPAWEPDGMSFAPDAWWGGRP